LQGSTRFVLTWELDHSGFISLNFETTFYFAELRVEPSIWRSRTLYLYPTIELQALYISFSLPSATRRISRLPGPRPEIIARYYSAIIVMNLECETERGVLLIYCLLDE
jgi:hypothetical protein